MGCMHLSRQQPDSRMESADAHTPPLRAAWQVRRSSARICASKTTANTSAVTSTTASSIGRSRDTTRAARARRKSTSLRVDSCCASCAKALRRSRSKCCAPLMLPSSSLSSTERSKRCSVALVTGTVRIVGLCGDGRPRRRRRQQRASSSEEIA
eukprot:scaffold25962_cov69-Phaeocystis_antarctica.AAC.1